MSVGGNGSTAPSQEAGVLGSKEGWTPSTFVSSRTNRRKDDPNAASQRPEDFMDEEDLADAAEAQKIRTSDAFAGLGTTESDSKHRGMGLAGIFRAEGDTMGVRLLKKMGWKEGQGIGPKVRRTARLDLKSAASAESDTYLFAPDDVPMIGFVRKIDHKGLGFAGETQLKPRSLTRAEEESEAEEEEEAFNWQMTPKSKNKANPVRGGIGIGVLNDTGSDDEDPFEIGPRISYNRVIGGDKKKKKAPAAVAAANPAVKSMPVFRSRKNVLARAAKGLRKCHDGRLPLDGFVLSEQPDPLISTINSENNYPPPVIPSGWKSSKTPKSKFDESAYKSTSQVAKETSLDPKARADILGEKQLPGKSVFDFISSTSRDQLAKASGKVNLPPGLGEVPEGYALSEDEKQQQLFNQVPKLDKETAIAAMTRGAGAGAPYAEDEAKRSRYRRYLEFHAGYGAMPAKPGGMKDSDWVHELKEFCSCARIFKPMAGAMASRFTTASNSKFSSGSTRDHELVAVPQTKPLDPAEEAAKMGMYGRMTRSVEDFFPTRLLCKRFNVKPPSNVQQDVQRESSGSRPSLQAQQQHHVDSPPHVSMELSGQNQGATTTAVLMSTSQPDNVGIKESEAVDAGKNDALEGTKAQEEVFKAIFGDSDEGEEEED